MEKWARIDYQPCLPLGDNQSRITGCERHIKLAYMAACEGSVLLKNEDAVLPLKKGSKVAIFGKAQIDYVKCGGGSGEVRSIYTRNIYQGLKMKSDTVEVFDKLSQYYENFVAQAMKDGKESGKFDECEIPKDLLLEAKEFADTAIITINRFSAEGWDRKNDGEDTYYVLSEQEKNMVDIVCDNFKKVIVLLNTGAMIDTAWFFKNDKIQAALMIWQGGMEGGLATADLLVGDATPSGKLVDTCVKSFDDYPSSENFHESDDYVQYTEDIFVGYRYFETIPNKKDRVIYPFGYGLSYTTFEFSNLSACLLNEKIVVNLTVTNTGNYAGKEVVQVYYGAPVGKITKSAKELCAFQKTKLLLPGESQDMILHFDVQEMASYDDVGVVRKSAYVMEKGTYSVFVGNSVRNLITLDYQYEISEDQVVKQLTSLCAPKRLSKRLLATGEYVACENASKEQKAYPCTYVCDTRIPEKKEDRKRLLDVANGEISLDDFIAQLTDEELIKLLKGCENTGVASTCGMGGLIDYGIPGAMTTDGPAGVRIGIKAGIRVTAFPIATMLACTWNTDLIEQIGAAGAKEVKENNMSIWLTPALNIHRTPLCGRNFEYFSEDPFVSGMMASSMVRGIQSENIVATPKHFACNNKETNRFESDSIVSERALREIYLKGFEICVKEAKPKLIMTAYNVINGVRASENAELIMGILREEWGYDGLVTTDWWNHASHTAELLAGNDIRMPASATTDLKEAYLEGRVTRNELACSVKRILNMILWLD